MNSQDLEKPGITLVSVGPGDPSLITFAAVEAIQRASTVAYPVPEIGAQSIAAQIAAGWIDSKQRKLPLVFPMVKDSSVLRKAWQVVIDKLIKLVGEGENVVFLSQGDCSIFSTSSYLLKGIKMSDLDFPVRQIPGVTSFAAAASIGGLPLCLQSEQLLVLPTPDNPETLSLLLDEAACLGRIIVLLKLGERWGWVKTLLHEKNILEEALFAEKVGFPDQVILQASKVSGELKPYFSLLIIRQSWPQIMP